MQCMPLPLPACRAADGSDVVAWVMHLSIYLPAGSYHHTGMVSMWYAMREALAIVGDEGLEAMWARHLQVGMGMGSGLPASCTPGGGRARSQCAGAQARISNPPQARYGMVCQPSGNRRPPKPIPTCKRSPGPQGAVGGAEAAGPGALRGEGRGEVRARRRPAMASIAFCIPNFLGALAGHWLHPGFLSWHPPACPPFPQPRPSSSTTAAHPFHMRLSPFLPPSG